MRAWRFGTRLLALFSFLTAAALIGCSGSKDEAPKTDSSAEEKKPKKKSKADMKPVASGTGVLKGKVTLEGSPPDLAAENAKLLVEINKKADDKDHCLAKDAKETEKDQQTWRIGSGNGVKNVFVFLAPASGTFFEVNDSHPGVQAVKDKTEVLDQPHCAFVPHALVLFPSYPDAKGKSTKTGQKLVIKNSAPMTHNTNYKDTADVNDGGNFLIKTGGSESISNLKPSKGQITIQCTIHPWMNAFMWVLDHPYYAITDENGNYEIKNVPEGDVNVVAWHEAAKFLTSGGSKGEKITLSKDSTSKDFTIKAK